jgi:hypothetical protein
MRSAIIAIAASLILVAPASAEYWLDRPTAQAYAGNYARTHHTVRGVTAKCWPKNHRDADTVNYTYHVWTCVWSGYENYGDGPSCYGAVNIKGSPGPGRYRYRAILGERC